MFVLGPIGIIYTSMSEELKTVRTKVGELQKEKATNEDVKAALEELKAQRKEQAVADKEQNDKLQTNQVAIERILIRQELVPPGGFKLRDDPGIKETPKRNTKTEESKISRLRVTKKPILSPDQFEKYLEMKPENQERYKKYLDRRGYDTDGL